MKTKKQPTTFLLVPLLLLFAYSTNGQSPTPSPTPQTSNEPKAEQIINRAIESIGGTAYLNVKTLIGRGFFTSYQDGVSQLPARFIDYISYPAKERTEFNSSGIRVIQTNVGDKGWVFDGATKSLTDMKMPQIEDFKRNMRASVENLLRGWWRNEGALVKYAGRREAGLAMRNDVVRLTYPDGFWIEFEFGVRDGRPAKIIYQRAKRGDSDEAEMVTEEDHLVKPIVMDGITAPWVIDHFINGIQTSRINYESIQYNTPIADSIFTKPENAKSVK